MIPVGRFMAILLAGAGWAAASAAADAPAATPPASAAAQAPAAASPASAASEAPAVAPPSPAASEASVAAPQTAAASEGPAGSAPVSPASAAAQAPAASAASGGAQAIVEQPRAYGHVVGDVLIQRIRLQRAGSEFEPADPPRAERVGAWFVRRVPRVERAPDGTRWLVAEHQLVNSPPALRTVMLPAWEIAPRAGGEALQVPAWPVSIAPITARNAPAQGALQSLQPDRPSPMVDEAAIKRALTTWIAALVATLAAWLGWLAWRQRRASRSQPFAIAARELRRLDPSTPAAWQALHRAFDRTAGRVIQRATLARLFERAPHLAPMREPIERFYAQSAQLFFGSSSPGDAIDVRALCARLRGVEKRHET